MQDMFIETYGRKESWPFTEHSPVSVNESLAEVPFGNVGKCVFSIDRIRAEDSGFTARLLRMRRERPSDCSAEIV